MKKPPTGGFFLCSGANSSAFLGILRPLCALAMLPRRIALLVSGGEPLQQLTAHLRAAEQGHMAGAIGNPAVGSGECKLVARLVMLAEGAAQGHKPIANQSISQQTALGCRGGCYGEAGHFGGQRQGGRGSGKAVCVLPCESGESITLPWRRSLMPALRSCASLTKGWV